MVVQQALALATAELWPGWPRGVRNLQAMACTSRHPRGYSLDLRLAASRHREEFCLHLESLGAQTCGQVLRLSTVQLQNTFGTTLGAQIAAMVRGYSRYRLK